MLVFTVFPVIMAILGSFKSNAEISLGDNFLPEAWQWSNYVAAWNGANFSRFTWNSLFISCAATVGTLFVASLAGYAVDRIEFPGKRWYVFIQSTTLFISIGAVVLRPQFDMMNAIGLNKSLLSVILIIIAGHATTFFILIGFYRSIPKDLDEAAMIDGCGFFRLYWQVILPLLAPGLGVAGLLVFRNGWNEYILPLIFTMSKPDLQPLTVGLANLRYGALGAAQQTHLMLAGACLSILPILVVYMFANKSFMQMSAGSIKG
ncbi:carbohydrate ABC transporter permease [Paenibacillus sp. YYML68]|uniref:carbohydrate ABC transporter permease n=1 Tax=Paenibacillus sp. YYML68 TaxID=2909250 RepID=UPI0024938AE1|nr:carbohydrate ABC transporter permease [Paenibacillus sp. YYML68]